MVTLAERIDAARTPPPGAPERPPQRNIAALLQTRTGERGDAPFLTYEDGATGERAELGYRSFLNWVAKTANLLHEELEVGPGDRVGVLLGHHWTTAVITVACWHVGACAVPVDPDEPVPAIREAVGALHIRTAFVREDLVPELHTLRRGTGLRTAVVVGAGLGGRLAGDIPDVPETLVYGDEVLAFADDYDDPTVGHDDPSLLVLPHLSGSPAPVLLTQGNLLAAARVLGWWGVSSADRMLCGAGPLTVASLVTAYLGSLGAGGSVVLARDFAPSTVWRTIDQERVTLAQLPAPLLDEIPPPEGTPPERFRNVMAPAGVSDAVAARAAASTGRPLIVGHGGAEASGAATLLPADVGDQTLQWIAEAPGWCVGTPTVEALVAAVDEAGSPLDPGVAGPLGVRGRLVMARYEDGEDRNEAVFAGGWCRTGEEGYVADGPDGRRYVFVSSRG